MRDGVTCIAVRMCLVLAALSPGRPPDRPMLWSARIVLWDECPGEPEHDGSVGDRPIVVIPT